MPITYRIHTDLGLVVTRFTGHVKDDEFVELYKAMLHDDDYALGTNELADLRAAESLNLSALALRRVEEITRQRYGDSGLNFRTAIIAPRDPLYGIGRMYEVFAEDGPENVKVCRDPLEALQWLDLDDDAVRLEP
jgi:hypothetical protein